MPMKKVDFKFYLMIAGIIIIATSGIYLLMDCEIFLASPCPADMQRLDPMHRIIASTVVFIGLIMLIVGIYLPQKN
jgi:hypothetical protein